MDRITAGQAAAILGVSRGYVARLVRNGRLKMVLTTPLGRFLSQDEVILLRDSGTVGRFSEIQKNLRRKG